MRLIDADQLISDIQSHNDMEENNPTWRSKDVVMLLENAPEPPNDPLTLKELREMVLLEWLWIEVIHPTKRQVFHKIESAYYQVFEDYTDGDALCCGWPGLIHEFEYEDYGKAWLASRRKPEEGTK